MIEKFTEEELEQIKIELGIASDKYIKKTLPKKYENEFWRMWAEIDSYFTNHYKTYDIRYDFICSNDIEKAIHILADFAFWNYAIKKSSPKRKKNWNIGRCSNIPISFKDEYESFRDGIAATVLEKAKSTLSIRDDIKKKLEKEIDCFIKNGTLKAKSHAGTQIDDEIDGLSDEIDGLSDELAKLPLDDI